jgi:hypothetical protein
MSHAQFLNAIFMLVAMASLDLLLTVLEMLG